MKKVIKKLASLLMVTVFVITGTTFQMLAGALSESVINGKQKLYISYYCSVSPAFFACLLGDATKGYFKRFIDGLLSSALSLVYMGLIYLAGSYWCKVLTIHNVGVDSPMDVLVWLSSAGPKILVVLAMGFLILKPPLALRQLTGGS